MYQWEFLVEGVPLMVGRFKISDRLILERVLGPTEELSSGNSQSLAVAYVAEDEKKRDARKYMDFFCFIYTFVTSKKVMYHQNIGTPLDNIGLLGKHKRGLPGYQKFNSESKEPHPVFDLGIIKARKLFLEMEQDMEKIMNNHLKMVFRFYYFAMSAGERLSRDEFIIHLFIAAEALIQTDGSPTKNIKRRIAILIGNDSADVKTIFKNIGELYRLRGLIIHGHKPKILISQTQQLDGYIRRAIEQGLKLRHMTKKDLVEMLDEKYDKMNIMK